MIVSLRSAKLLVPRKVERSTEDWLYSISDCTECVAFVRSQMQIDLANAQLETWQTFEAVNRAWWYWALLSCSCKGTSSVSLKVGCTVLVDVLVSVLHLFGAQCKGTWQMYGLKLGKRFRWLTELGDKISTAGFALFGLSVSVTELYWVLMSRSSVLILEEANDYTKQNSWRLFCCQTEAGCHV